MRTLFILLFSCLPCLAQFGVEQPMFQLSSAPFSPRDIAGLGYWWHSGDLPLDNAVSSWADKIQGVVLTNSTAASQPTNSAYGVGFKGSTLLTNMGAFNWSTLNSMFIVVQWTDPNQTLSPMVFGGYASPYYFKLASKAWADAWVNGSRWSEQFGTTTRQQCLQNSESVPTNSILTLCVTINTTGPVRSYYTNGVSTGITSTTTALKFDQLGADKDGWYFKGYIKELLFYTNTVLSATSVSNLNYWAQNP